jgi:PAS domain S-box-containing protein
MKAEELDKQSAEAAATIRALQDELTESNRGLVALHMELDERVQQRTAELAQANESLRESEERFRLLVEGVKDCALFMLDPEGRVASWNLGAKQVLGYPPNEILGQSFACFYAPEDLAQNAPTRELSIAKERSQTSAEGWRIRKDGSRFWAETVFTALCNRAGELRGFAQLTRDITERKRAEDEMRESEEKYRTLFESIDQGFCTIEVLFDENERPVDYRFLTANPAFERQTGIQNGVGRCMREVAPLHEEHWFEVYGRIALTGESMRFESPAAQLNRFYDVFAWRVGAPMERKVAILFNDISERKRAAIGLQEANASLEKRVEERTSELAQRAAQLRALAGELTLAEQRERSRLAKILHDHLQQLLVATKFRTAVLGRGGDQLVRQATKEVEDLIDESIAASRSLTAELSPPILHEAGLNAGLQWLARRMADTQGLFVDLELKESGPLPEDLKVLLFESVRELLFNVVKHANTRSAVVNLRHFDGSLQVTVSDQGVGFDPTAMPAAGEEGAGFGLFSIRERLELMGGTFEIGSSLGQGSRFVLTLPIAPSTVIESPPKGILVLPKAHLMPSGYPDPGRKIRVMLVDDHAVVRQGIANLLRDQPDIEVIGEAADGQEAVELAARLLPNVILMDVSIPKLDGVEATRIIHNDWPEIRIIGLSMFEEADRARAMRDAGAVDYITKSGPAEELIHVIRTSIRATNKLLSTRIPS